MQLAEAVAAQEAGAEAEHPGAPKADAEAEHPSGPKEDAEATTPTQLAEAVCGGSCKNHLRPDHHLTQ